MKRLGIFVFYDKQGIVDRYVKYLLDGLKRHLSRLVIVCNGFLTDDGRHTLSKYSQEIYVRENTGFDAMGYKLAMTLYLGWDQVEQFDEILLFNDTFYGPIFPFSEMFDAMEKKQCDFWGITCEKRFNDYLFGTDTITPTHIHTYFCVYRKSAVISDAFRNYWNEFDSTEWFFSDVCRHEMTFTEVLEKGGLTWKTYVELPDYHDIDMLDSSVNPYYSLAYDIIKFYRCPILKRKNFIIKNLSWRTGTGGEDTKKALQYVAEQTDYDENLIWENILRLYNIYEIKNALHLDYILPWKGKNEHIREMWDRIAILIYVPENDTFLELKDYIDQMPEDAYVKVHKTQREWKDCIRSLDKQYKYICFISLYEFLPQEPMTVRKSLNYNLLENMIKSENYISHIIQLYEENPRLGILAAPYSVHGNNLGQLHDLWGDSYDNVSAQAEELRLNVNIAYDTPCVNTDLAMWCRTEAIQPFLSRIVDCSTEVIAKICPYIAQSQGYYTGTVMNTEYASLQTTNLMYELTGIVQKCFKEHAFTDYKSLLEADIASIVKGYKYAVIYGAGANGIKTSNLFKKNGLTLQGFMISDDQPRQAEKNGYPIYRLSEFPFNREETMVIVSVAYARSRNEIVKNLEDKGFKHYSLL